MPLLSASYQFSILITIQDARKEVFAAKNEQENDIDISISDGRWPDEEAIKGLKQVSGLPAPTFVNKLTCALWIKPEQASEELETHLGGFAGIVEEGKYSLIEKNGQYRMEVVYTSLMMCENAPPEWQIVPEENN